MILQKAAASRLSEGPTPCEIHRKFIEFNGGQQGVAEYKGRPG
jgi:hypothetical protein